MGGTNIFPGKYITSAAQENSRFLDDFICSHRNVFSMMNDCRLSLLFMLFLAPGIIRAQKTIQTRGNKPPQIFNPSTLLWYTSPAKKWEEALPVGNGRLGAMVFGKYKEERIQLNEETYWSGGPYSTVVKGGHKVLPEIQKLVFEEKYLAAHNLFGRHLMGYPVEQQKYQAWLTCICFLKTRILLLIITVGSISKLGSPEFRIHRMKSLISEKYLLLPLTR